MITYGFFNSVNGDRLYNAESFNNYFEGLISSNGVFESVEGGFVVTPGSGLEVNVESGKAVVNSCWVKSNSVETFTLDAAHNLFGRYDVIYLSCSVSDRNVTLNYKAGTPSSNPVKSKPTRSSDVYEIYLAYIYVAPNATVITAGNIEDCRYNTELCGIVHGLIEQVDTTTLYNQYRNQFNSLITHMRDWQQQQENSFSEWFSTLTEQLNINTYITKSFENITIDSTTRYIDIPKSLNYVHGDILFVFLNGILCVEMVDYTIMINEVENTSMLYMHNQILADNLVTIYCLKSVIGFSTI